jgi:hypothetical protein
MTVLRLPRLIAVAFLTTLQSIQATVTISDGTFDPANWLQTDVFHGDGGSAVRTQELSGGNPGSYHRVQTTMNPTTPIGSEPRSQVFSFFGYSSVMFSPGTQGAIASLDYTFDTIFLSGNAGPDGAAFHAALQ